MDMLNRIADAIYDRYGPEVSGGLCEAIARLAVEIMREPTEAMIDAGYDVGYSPDPLPTDEVWRAMIDAALSRPTPEKE